MLSAPGAVAEEPPVRCSCRISASADTWQAVSGLIPCLRGFGYLARCSLAQPMQNAWAPPREEEAAGRAVLGRHARVLARRMEQTHTNTPLRHTRTKVQQKHSELQAGRRQIKHQLLQAIDGRTDMQVLQPYEHRSRQRRHTEHLHIVSSEIAKGDGWSRQFCGHTPHLR